MAASNLYSQFNQIVREVFALRNIEVRGPKPGFRHQKGHRLVHHRFAIKGGFSIIDAPNPWFLDMQDRTGR
jgi:hypothetical protein